MATTTYSPATQEACPDTSELKQVERVGSAALPAVARRSFQQGIELLNGGEAQAAARAFEQALEAAPDFADGHVGLGIAYAIDSQVYPALDHFERAAELDSGNFFAHFKLGQFYFKLRIPQKGYAEIARALECATTIEERKLVAQVLREERHREHNAVRRPWWNKPFSRAGLFVSAALGTAAILMLLLRLA